jgi:hypothetical protein
MVFSDGIPSVPRNRKLSEFCSENSTEEITTRNSVPLKKNRSKLSEFPSEPFSRKENNLEYRSMEPKWKQILRIPFRILQRKRKQLEIQFCGTKMEANSRNSVVNHSAEEKTS